MQLDLKNVFNGVEPLIPFSMTLDLSGMEEWGDRPFKEAIAIEGKVQNRAGIVTVTYHADYHLSANCARCLEPVERQMHQEFFHTVVEHLNQEEDDDYIVCEDGILDMDQLAQDDILLELPIRLLCSEDCKGLCPMCGCNLNKEQCSCQEPEWKPGRATPFANLEWPKD